MSGPAAGKANPLGPDHGPMEAEAEKVGRDLGHLIGQVMPEGYGFALLIFGMGDHPGRMNYISNGRREDMIKALHELLARMEGRHA